MPTAYVEPFIDDDRRRSRTQITRWVPAVVIAALIAIAAISPTLQPGPFIRTVTVVNTSEYAVDVAVAGASAHGWTLLGTAVDHASTPISTVFDQGSTWTIRFTTQGRVLGDIVSSRADLSSNGWRIEVPDRFVQALRTEGVVPTA
jgi:hypothetical protein